MIMRRGLAVIGALGFCASLAISAPALNVGDKPEPLTLSGEAGGRVDGAPWSSDMIKDRVWLVFYISPSHRNDNEELKDALKAAAFDHDKFGSIAVINMAASWLPNSILASALKSNQEKYPEVTYVKDMDKLLVNKWHLPDDAFDVIIFDKTGHVLMHKDGDFNAQNVKETVELIKHNL